MMPKHFEFYCPLKIISGDTALESLVPELEFWNAKRPMIITDKGIVNAGLINNVLNEFNGMPITPAAIYDSVPPDSSIDVVVEISKIFKDNNCDSFIAVGGGSVIDTAKGVNTLISENAETLMDFIGYDRLTKPQKPLIIVPTTSGTGSEATLVAVVNNPAQKVKMLFLSHHLIPKVAILDSRMTETLPPRLTAETGMDALTHAIEAYTSMQKNPISDSFAISAINLVCENIVETVKDGKNRKARLAMANASLCAGIAFSNSMVGTVHAIGHACGSVAHIPHGQAMNILLPHVIEFNMDKLSSLYGELLIHLKGSDFFSKTKPHVRGQIFLEVIKDLQKELNRLSKMPLKFSETKLTTDQFEEIAKTAINDGSIISNPKETELEDIIKILNKAY